MCKNKCIKRIYKNEDSSSVSIISQDIITLKDGEEFAYPQSCYHRVKNSVTKLNRRLNNLATRIDRDSNSICIALKQTYGRAN